MLGGRVGAQGVPVKCIHSSSSLYYADKDIDTGFCRMPMALFDRFRADPGSVVHLIVILSETCSYEVLCTAWPHTRGLVDDNEICIDDVVYRGEKRNWTIAQCKIHRIFPGNDCTTLRIDTSDSSSQANQPHISTFGGYAACDGFFVDSSANPSKTFKIIGPNTPAVVTPLTLLILSNSGNASSFTPMKSSGERLIATATSVVRRIIRDVIWPSVALPVKNNVSIQGLLLLGPPGVGKSYAITAVRELCKAWCTVSVHNLSIPDVLADPDPVGYTREILAKARANCVPEECPISTAPLHFTPSTEIEPMTPGTGKRSPFSFKHTGFSSSSSTVSTPVSSACTPMSLSPFSARGTPAGRTSTGTSTRMRPLPEVHILMLDELDALGSGGEKSSSGSETQTVVKSLICSWMDHKPTSHVRAAVIATTNRPAEVDPCFRRGGRLEKDIDVLESSTDDRSRLFRSLLNQVRPELSKLFQEHMNKDESYNESKFEEDIERISDHIALATGGYVAADVTALVREATGCTASSISKGTLPPSYISGNTAIPNLSPLGDVLAQCLMEAKALIPPSCLRKDAIKIPSLTYEDVIGYADVKNKLGRVLAFADAESRIRLQRFGLTGAMGGVLLYGPPGNSKTRLVMAAASTHSLPVISLSAADVYSAYVGDAEAEIRRVFRLARQAHPCVLFFDELDALVTDRGSGGSSSSSNVESRVLASLLTEMDGIDGAGDGVFVIAATNKIENIDAALLRKGRFHHLLHVPTPSMEDMQELVLYFGRRYGLSVSAQENIRIVLREGMSGADVENLCREAGMQRVKSMIAVSSSPS